MDWKRLSSSIFSGFPSLPPPLPLILIPSLLLFFAPHHQNNNRLTAHFGGVFAEFEDVFKALSTFSSSYSSVLAKSFEADVASEKHFAMRFLVTELAKHLEQVSQPLEAAQVQMVRAAVSARPGKMPFQDFQNSSGQLSATRRAKRAAQASESAEAAGNTLEAQVSRLAKLVDGLSTRANLGTAEISHRKDSENAVLVHSAMEVQDDQLESFRGALTRYAGALNACEECKHVRVLYEDEAVDCYEIWSSTEALEGFRRAAECKAGENPQEPIYLSVFSLVQQHSGAR